MNTQPLSPATLTATDTGTSAEPQGAPVSPWETLRTRLIISFTSVVLLPILAIVFISTISGAQSNQREVTSNLLTIMNYKEAAVKTWARTVKAELGAALGSANFVANIETFLALDGGQAVPGAPTLDELRQSLRTYMAEQVIKAQYFDGYILLSPTGRLLIETGQIGQELSATIAFTNSSLVRVGALSPHIDATSFTRDGRPVILAGVPVVNPDNQVVAILAGWVKLGSLNNILLDNTGLGETGQTYLVRLRDRSLVSGPVAPMGSTIDNPVVQAAIQGEIGKDLTYRKPNGQVYYSIYRQIPDLQAVMVAEQAETETGRISLANLAVTSSVALASMFIALFISLVVTRSITLPVTELAASASAIAGGEREITVEVQRKDEIGVMAEAFNSMTGQLRTLIESLEQRVAERTRELAKRTRYLEASAEVSQATASILDLNELLNQAVEVIRERFDLYYVGLFLADETRRWAVLRSGTGEAGKAMLARRHRLEIGPTSMIGWSIANAQARIAQLAAEDEVRQRTTELPETRSEAAFPLRSRGLVIGAITVQSSLPNAYDETAIAVLQQMADALAIAIDNARLLSESQQALEAERRAYATQTQAAWEQLMRARRTFHVVTDVQGMVHIEPAAAEKDFPYTEMELAQRKGQTVSTDRNQQDSSQREAVAVPIRVRGQVIGVLDVAAPLDERGKPLPWTGQEIAFLENIADQLGLALDSARLFEETRRRAERERLAGQITARLRASNDPQTILDTAVRELRQVLQAKRAQILIQPAASVPEVTQAGQVEGSSGNGSGTADTGQRSDQEQ